MKRLWIGLVTVLLLGTPLAALEEDEVMVPAVINGKPVRLGFDTGAGLSVALWQKAADALGVTYQFPENVVDANPTHVIPGTSSPLDIELAGHAFTRVQIPVVKLPLHLARDFEGLVGWSALSANILRFELSKGSPEVLQAVPEECARWTRYRLLAKSTTLAFEVPGKGILAVDTGAGNGLSLSHRDWTAWRGKHGGPAATLDDYFMLGSGTMIRDIVSADQYDIGGETLRHVLLEEASPTNAADYGPDYFATLGRAALRQMVMVVDGLNGWVYIKMKEGTPALQPYNRLGAVFTTDGDADTLVGHVLPGGPANRAGIKDGDVLLKIDDTDVTKWRSVPGLYPIRQFFKKPAGTRLVLTVLRGTDTLKVAVVLEELIK